MRQKKNPEGNPPEKKADKPGQKIGIGMPGPPGAGFPGNPDRPGFPGVPGNVQDIEDILRAMAKSLDALAKSFGEFVQQDKQQHKELMAELDKSLKVQQDSLKTQKDSARIQKEDLTVQQESLQLQNKSAKVQKELLSVQTQTLELLQSVLLPKPGVALQFKLGTPVKQ